MRQPIGKTDKEGEESKEGTRGAMKGLVDREEGE
jgi:hypothetical protein